MGFDTEVADLSYLISYTGSDNYNAGKVCGEDLVKKCPDGGDIIVLDSPTMNSVTDRTNGFLDAIEGKGFNIRCTAGCQGNLEVPWYAEDLLQAHGDVVAISEAMTHCTGSTGSSQRSRSYRLYDLRRGRLS